MPARGKGGDRLGKHCTQAPQASWVSESQERRTEVRKSVQMIALQLSILQVHPQDQLGSSSGISNDPLSKM